MDSSASTSQLKYKVFISQHFNVKGEDRYSVQSVSPSSQLVGVYDGHGGSATAQYISEELPRKITELLNLNSSEQTLETIPSILREAFVSVDQQMIQDFETTFRGSLILPISRWRSSHIESKLNDPAVYEIASRTMSGSTALVAYIDGEGLQIANTGDCRAVLAVEDQNGNLNALPLTQDLNASSSFERNRVCEQHPNEDPDELVAGDRLFGQLSVTRAFGDSFYKMKDTRYTDQVHSHKKLTPPKQLPVNQKFRPLYPLLKTPPYLTAEPEITDWKLEGQERFLIMASDGLWGLADVDNQWAVDTVREGIAKRVEDPAAYLLEKTLEKQPGDDVTILVVMLK